MLVHHEINIYQNAPSLQLIREQFKGRDYNRLEPEKFQFNTANSYADAGLRIELANTTEAELLGWQVALDSIDKVL